MKLRNGRPGRWVATIPAVVAFFALSASALATVEEPRIAEPSAAFQAYQARLELGRALTFGGALDHGLGMIPDPIAAELRSGTGTRQVLRGAFPTSYDLRAVGKLTGIKDQGQYNTCWAFAANASLESGLLPGEEHDFSEDNMVLTAGFGSGDAYDNGGTYMMSAAYLARWGGPVDETSDAYGDGYTPSGLTATKHVQEVLYISGGTSGGDTSAIKSALMTYGAVATAMKWSQSSYSAAQDSYYYSGSAAVDHGVTIVGWDDSFSASRFASAPAGNGAWLVRNSWGGSWGDGGYFWVSYYDRHCARSTSLNAVFTRAEDSDNYDAIYQYDPYGEVALFGYGNTTAWMANVFTAKSSQAVTAVGFFTDVPGTTYSVYAAKTNSSGAPGTLKAKGSGTIATPGYHTVQLSSPWGVTKGGKFAVVVRVTAPGLTTPISVEMREYGYTNYASASAKQSYVRPSSTASWLDITKVSGGSTANVCLKAFAANDTQAPTTKASSLSVKRYKQATFKFRISDPQPSCGTAKAKIQILKGTKVVKTVSVGNKSTNANSTYKWKATLAKGNYTWRVLATDAAGFAASTTTSAGLAIK